MAILDDLEAEMAASREAEETYRADPTGDGYMRMLDAEEDLADVLVKHAGALLAVVRAAEDLLPETGTGGDSVWTCYVCRVTSDPDDASAHTDDCAVGKLEAALKALEGGK